MAKSKPQNCIDFDLNIEDFKKVAILIKDISVDLSYDDLNDYDGQLTEHECNTNFSECKFCDFTSLIRRYFARVKLDSFEEQKELELRYKINNYSHKLLDWSEYQVFRGVFSLLAFSICNSKEDLLKALKRFDHSKSSYKKTLIESKLFILLQNKNEFGEELIEPNRRDSNMSIHTNIDEEELLKANEKISNQNGLSSQIDTELNTQLKQLEGNIIYLDDQLNKQDLSKIKKVIHQISSKIYVELSKRCELVNPHDEKQISYFSEYLKNPIERDNTNTQHLTQSTLTLQVKYLNKKKTMGRMNKYKGDLYLLLNQIDQAVLHYSKAYSTLKKENDPTWTSASLLGLAVASIFYYDYINSEKFETQSITSEILGNTNRRPTLKRFSSVISQSLKKSKETKNLVIPNKELFENFKQILDVLNKHSDFVCLELELSLLFARYCTKSKYDQDKILCFIEHAIFNVAVFPLTEESRIRRYLETSKVYEDINYKRAASFYKWVSCGRIFHLMRQTSPNAELKIKSNLKRILNTCCNYLFSVFEILNIVPQLKPCNTVNDSEKGFPLAKKRVIIEYIHLSHQNDCSRDAFKFSRYLVHELYKYLNIKELNDKISYLLTTPRSTFTYSFNEMYFSNFFRIPILNSFKISIQKDNTITKLPRNEVNETTKSIFLHRYENPLLSAKKPTVHMAIVNEIYSIDIKLTNPLPIDIQIDKLSLLLDTNLVENTNEFDEECQLVRTLNFLPFKLSANTVDQELKLDFTFNQVGNFKVVGYLIISLNCESKILFGDLIKNVPQAKGKNASRMENISSEYNFEVIPKLPSLQEIKITDENGSNRSVHITSDPKIILKSFFGEEKLYNMSLQFDEENVIIIDTSFRVLSEDESTIKSIRLTELINENHQNYKKFQINLSPIGKQTVINCLVEWKFTNSISNENYLCRIVRKNIAFEFIEPLSLVNYSISDVEIDIDFNNMIENDLNLHLKNLNNEIIVSIPRKSIKSVTVQIEKLNLGFIEEDLNKHLNEKLLFKLSYLNSNSLIPLRLNFKQSRLYEKCVFKCPLEMIFKNYQLKDTMSKILFLLRPTVTFETIKNKYIKTQFSNKIGYCIIKNDFTSEFKNLEKDQILIKEVHFLERNNNPRKPLEINFILNGDDSIPLEWRYIIDFFKEECFYVTK